MKCWIILTSFVVKLIPRKGVKSRSTGNVGEGLKNTYIQTYKLIQKSEELIFMIVPQRVRQILNSKIQYFHFHWRKNEKFLSTFLSFFSEIRSIKLTEAFLPKVFDNLMIQCGLNFLNALMLEKCENYFKVELL